MIPSYENHTWMKVDVRESNNSSSGVLVRGTAPCLEVMASSISSTPSLGASKLEENSTDVLGVSEVANDVLGVSEVAMFISSEGVLLLTTSSCIWIGRNKRH